MLDVRQGHVGLDLSSRPVTQCASPLLANYLMLRTRHLPITVSACTARFVRALSSTIVGNIDSDQTRLLLIVECGVERLYRGPHGIERRHESSQSLSLTSAVRLIHRRRLSCREANVEGVQRRHH